MTLAPERLKPWWDTRLLQEVAQVAQALSISRLRLTCCRVLFAGPAGYLGHGFSFHAQ
jgi:hypothetical protein